MFDNEKECVDQNSFSCILDSIDENEENDIVIIDWEIVENNEDVQKIKVKVTNVYKF